MKNSWKPIRIKIWESGIGGVVESRYQQNIVAYSFGKKVHNESIEKNYKNSFQDFTMLRHIKVSIKHRAVFVWDITYSWWKFKLTETRVMGETKKYKFGFI
jgi:hypothetical protein